MQSGWVLNIQRYSIHDGPGIRTTVFLKGCPARCWWCHNPESQSAEPELLVLQGRCVRCGACVEACPEATAAHESASAETPPMETPPVETPPVETLPAEARPPETLPAPVSSTCTVCGACVDVCMSGARMIAGTRMTADEVLTEVLKDRIFYEESGGGLTFSGGEPLMQFEYLEAVLEPCRGRGLHTAVDTCGFAPREHMLAIAPLTDLFLYDLKLMDGRRHRETTGVSNAPILENLRALGEVHDRIWIRVPVIPGVNDDRANLEAMARFAAGVRAVRQVNLLPYHRMGIHKADCVGKADRHGTVGRHGNVDALARLAPPSSDRLGKVYALAQAAPPSPDRLEELAEIFRARGLETKTGG